jgi:hypothetical protein
MFYCKNMNVATHQNPGKMGVHYLQQIDLVYIKIVDRLQEERVDIDNESKEQLGIDHEDSIDDEDSIEYEDRHRVLSRRYYSRVDNTANQLYLYFKEIRSPPLEHGDFGSHIGDPLFLLRLVSLLGYLDSRSNEAERSMMESDLLGPLFQDFKTMVYGYVDTIKHNEASYRKGRSPSRGGIDHTRNPVLADDVVVDREIIRYHDVQWNDETKRISDAFYNQILDEYGVKHGVDSERYREYSKVIEHGKECESDVRGEGRSWEESWCQY